MSTNTSNSAKKDCSCLLTKYLDFHTVYV